MGLSHTVSEINGDFSQKSQNFPTHGCILRPAEGVPLGIVGTGVRVQDARMMGLIQYTRVKQADSRDGRTDTGRQQRPRLRIAALVKNVSRCHLPNKNKDNDIETLEK